MSIASARVPRAASRMTRKGWISLLATNKSRVSADDTQTSGGPSNRGCATACRLGTTNDRTTRHNAPAKHRLFRSKPIGLARHKQDHRGFGHAMLFGPATRVMKAS
jgi:hypothetical protein